MAVNPGTPNCIDFYDMEDGERLERSCLGSDAQIGGLVGWSEQDMLFVNTHDSVVGLSESVRLLLLLEGDRANGCWVYLEW